MDYRREIDGLRALAVLPVIFFHAGFKGFAGGFVGVDIFFVISGYLITSIILTEKKTGTFSLISFYERRARRILPALFVVMFACLPFAWLFLLPEELKTFSQSLIAVSCFSSNIFFWHERGYFDTAIELKPLIHTWSLAVEEQYYLFFPLCLIFTWKYKRKLIFPMLLVVGCLSLILSYWFSEVHPDSAFFLLPTRTWELLLGSCLSFFDFDNTYDKTKSQQMFIGREFLGILGLVFIFYAVIVFDKETPFPSFYALIPTIGTMLILLFSTKETIVGKLLGSKLLVGVGLISYSTYLWHQPLFAFARHGIIGEPTKNMFVFLATLAMALGYLSWRYVENPFRDRHNFSKKTIFSFSGVTLLFFCFVGFLGWKSDGFISRYPFSEQQILREISGARYYTARRFDSTILKPFETEHEKKRVILIGDSYGKDLLNALFESKLNKKFDISTYRINGECGNLYLDFDFTEKIQKNKVAKCKMLGWYDNQKLFERINESDEIWLASSWVLWVAELLPQSIENMESKFGKKVKVFGGKSFGTVDLKKILNSSPEVRKTTISQIEPNFIQLNQRMQSALPPDVFINVSELLCENDLKCPLFTYEGKLISYDGGHLTKSGAAYLGEKLLQHHVL